MNKTNVLATHVFNVLNCALICCGIYFAVCESDTERNEAKWFQKCVAETETANTQTPVVMKLFHSILLA